MFNLPTTLTLLLGSLALTTSSPIHLSNRAGGPAVTPIPSNCSIISTTTSSSVTTSSNTNSNDTIPTHFKPTSSAVNASAVYSWYLDSTYRNVSADYTTCLEQCYGFGTSGNCKSVFFATNFPVPEGYYGGAGGWLGTGCVMFDHVLSADDFEGVSGANYTDARASGIEC